MHMTNITVKGQKIKIAVTNCGKTREKVVVLVQEALKDHGLSFSLAGLDKLQRDELPKKNAQIILEALADVLEKDVSDFAEFEAIAS